MAIGIGWAAALYASVYVALLEVRVEAEFAYTWLTSNSFEAVDVALVMIVVVEAHALY